MYNILYIRSHDNRIAYTRSTHTATMMSEHPLQTGCHSFILHETSLRAVDLKGTCGQCSVQGTPHFLFSKCKPFNHSICNPIYCTCANNAHLSGSKSPFFQVTWHSLTTMSPPPLTLNTRGSFVKPKLTDSVEILSSTEYPA